MTAEKEKVGVERHRSRKAEKQRSRKNRKTKSGEAEKQRSRNNRKTGIQKKINFIKKIMPKLNSPPKESHDFKRAILLKMFLSACHVW